MWPSSSSGPNQWSLNPTAYQNIPYEQVDWASLAQQWIKMKETMPSMNQGPPPPPAPTISKPAETVPPKSTPTVTENQSNSDIEGGEAPMDMDTKDDEAPVSPVGVAPGGNWNQWGNWQSQWGWGWPGNAGTVPLGEKTPSTASTVDSKVKSQSNDSVPVLNNYVSNVGNFPAIGNTSGTSTPQVPSSFNYNNIGGGMIPPVLPKSGYWNESAKTGSETWSKGNKTNSRHASQKSAPNPVEQFLTMDAAKKKQLPAWIREGLNKMEREKQKKLERERMLQEKYMMDQIPSEESAIPEAPVEPIQNFTQFQNFVPAEEPVKKSPPPSNFQNRQRSRSPSMEPPPRQQQRSSRMTREDYNAIRKTKDQIMEESMLKVRRILTEILLEVTENQVHIIAKEEFRRAKSASAQQIRKSNALTSLTGNLGLDVYDSESESSGNEENDSKGLNSDEELKIVIDKKRKEFERIEDEIEQEIEEQVAKERLIVQQDENDDDEDDPENNEHSEKENQETYRSQNTIGNRENKEVADRVTANHKSDDYDSHRNDTRSSQPKSSPSRGDKVNGENATEKAKGNKPKTKSGSSTSSSSSSSASSSSESTSGDSSSTDSDGSSNGDHQTKKKRKKRKRKVRKKEETPRASKRSRYRSKSRSTSKSRHSRDDKNYKKSRNRRPESNERRHGSPRRRSSPGRHRRSSSYHRESRDSSNSKYRDSRRRESVDSRRGRHRSSSRESRHSRYKRR